MIGQVEDRRRPRGRSYRRARAGRRRALGPVLFSALVALAAVGAVATTIGNRSATSPHSRGASSHTARSPGVPHGLPAAEAGLLPWHLPAPVSREVVVAAPGRRLLVLGGLTAGNVSVKGIYALHTGGNPLDRAETSDDLATGVRGGVRLRPSWGWSPVPDSAPGPGWSTHSCTPEPRAPPRRADAATCAPSRT